MTYMTFTYTYTYYTTYEQEMTVDEQVQKVLDKLDVYDSGTYHKIKGGFMIISVSTHPTIMII